jgi:hypothetical protein
MASFACSTCAIGLAQARHDAGRNVAAKEAIIVHEGDNFA